MYKYIPNDDTQNRPFYRFQLVVETFGHSTLKKIPWKSPKLLSQRIGKRYYKTLGNSIMFPPSWVVRLEGWDNW